MAGWWRQLSGHLDDAGLPGVTWQGTTPNPRDHGVAEGTERHLESGCDVTAAIPSTVRFNVYDVALLFRAAL